MSNFDNSGLRDGVLSNLSEKSYRGMNGVYSNMLLESNVEKRNAGNETLEINGHSIPVNQVKDAIKFAAEAEGIKKAIDRKIAECLKTIHARYCLLYGFEYADVDLCKIEDKHAGRPSYVEYWYMLGTEHQAFLMSKEVVIVEGAPRLNILFNEDLIRDGE